jgi:hypothetical protein
MSETVTFLERRISPMHQALVAFAGLLIFVFLSKILEWSGLLGSGFLATWIICASFLMLFGMFNSLMYMSAEDLGKYWSRSIFSFAALAILSGLTGWAITGVSIGDAATFKWLYLVLTIGYLVFLSIVGFIRVIIDLAKKKDTRDFSNRRHRH